MIYWEIKSGVYNGREVVFKIPSRTITVEFQKKLLKRFKKWREIYEEAPDFVVEPIEFRGGELILEKCEKTAREVAGRIDIEEAIRIIKSVARALEVAHRKGVFHLDVKPENILFCKGKWKLGDWDTAWIEGEEK